MIRLESSSLLTRYFVWSCDHLPLTTGRYVEAGSRVKARRGIFYVENGTTLCHIFWAIFWVPLFAAAIASFVLLYIVAVHIQAHAVFMKANPDSGTLTDVASYFLPEMMMLGVALFAGCVILAIIGGSKTGFFSLLWQYLKGIKQRVCPLVQFDRRQP